MAYLKYFDTNGKSLDDEEFKQFGAPMREHFMIDPNIIAVNHGSFGAVPKSVYDSYLKGLHDRYSFPDKLFFVDHMNLYNESIKCISEIINCDSQDIFICANATTGVNNIFRSLKWNAGDKIVISNFIYASCKTLMDYMNYTYKVEIITVEVEFPNDNDEAIVKKFSDAIHQHEQVKVCFFDNICSFPQVKFPVKQLIDLCKETGVMSVVDAAHGIGCEPVNLKQLDPDFYVTNVHKWYYVPAGYAVLYLNKKYHKLLQPFPIGYTFIPEDSDDTEDMLTKKFCYLGTNSYAHFTTIIKAKEFRESVGGDEVIWQYTQLLIDQVITMIKQKWGDDCLVGDPTTMFNVTPPFEVDMKKLELIEFDHGLYIRKGVLDGRVLLRFSVNIYNCLEDYEKAMVVVEMCKV